MANPVPWKIEKTNFNFVWVGSNQTLERNFACVGEEVVKLMAILSKDLSGRDVIDSHRVKINANGEEIRATFRESYGELMELWDPLNVKKEKMQEKKSVILIQVEQTNSLRYLYTSTLPQLFKSTISFSRQFAIIHMTSGTSEPGDVTHEEVQTLAEFVGATHVITMDHELLMQRRHENDVDKLCEQIALQVPAKISYTDKAIVSRFKMLALVRYGKLEQIQKQKNILDPEFRDPFGNNLLHYTVHASNIEVFYCIADQFPDLINEQDVHGYTPVHLILERIDLDWNRLWALPIKFSRKNRNEKTCLMLMEAKVYGPAAFEALISNEHAWRRARKYHKRKVILTNVVRTLLERWQEIDQTENEGLLAQKVEFFVKNGASIHHHENKSLLNLAIKKTKYKSVVKLLQRGAALRTEDFLTCWDLGSRKLIRLLIKRPEMNNLSQIELDKLVKRTVGLGYTDILKNLVKKGGKIELNFNYGVISTANLVAQILSTSVMPLKYLCVDVVYESVAQDEAEKSSEDNGETSENGVKEIDWNLKLRGYPEEIISLFPRKELWRWVLFLKDEQKQTKILKLYQSVNKSVKLLDSPDTMKLKYGKFEFYYSKSDTERCVWTGGPKKGKFPMHRMYYQEFVETTSGGYTEVTEKVEETGKEILTQVLTACGWDLEDDYIFLNILRSACMEQVDNGYVEFCFFDLFIFNFKTPPQWYSDFLLQNYGVNHPAKPTYED